MLVFLTIDPKAINQENYSNQLFNIGLEHIFQLLAYENAVLVLDEVCELEKELALNIDSLGEDAYIIKNLATEAFKKNNSVKCPVKPWNDTIDLLIKLRIEAKLDAVMTDDIRKTEFDEMRIDPNRLLAFNKVLPKKHLMVQNADKFQKNAVRIFQKTNEQIFHKRITRLTRFTTEIIFMDPIIGHIENLNYSSWLNGFKHIIDYWKMSSLINHKELKIKIMTKHPYVEYGDEFEKRFKIEVDKRSSIINKEIIDPLIDKYKDWAEITFVMKHDKRNMFRNRFMVTDHATVIFTKGFDLFRVPGHYRENMIEYMHPANESVVQNIRYSLKNLYH
jgi:hypothetical protein